MDHIDIHTGRHPFPRVTWPCSDPPTVSTAAAGSTSMPSAPAISDTHCLLADVVHIPSCEPKQPWIATAIGETETPQDRHCNGKLKWLLLSTHTCSCVPERSATQPQLDANAVLSPFLYSISLCFLNAAGRLDSAAQSSKDRGIAAMSAYLTAENLALHNQHNQVRSSACKPASHGQPINTMHRVEIWLADAGLSKYTSAFEGMSEQSFLELMMQVLQTPSCS